jgi:chromosome segregation ATPase
VFAQFRTRPSGDRRDRWWPQQQGYGSPVTSTQEQRITDLESDVHRIGHRLDRFSGAVEHLTNAAGDLSQSQRGIALDAREIRTEVAEVSAALVEHGSRLERLEATLAGHGELLRAILARLGGKPEQGTNG